MDLVRKFSSINCTLLAEITMIDTYPNLSKHVEFWMENPNLKFGKRILERYIMIHFNNNIMDTVTSRIQPSYSFTKIFIYLFKNKVIHVPWAWHGLTFFGIDAPNNTSIYETFKCFNYICVGRSTRKKWKKKQKHD